MKRLAKLKNKQERGQTPLEVVTAWLNRGWRRLSSMERHLSPRGVPTRNVKLVDSEEISLCGAVDLLAAILDRDRDELRERYGLPLTIPRCQNCGQPISQAAARRRGYCRDCWVASRYILVVCDGCGRIFLVLQSHLLLRIKRNKLGLLFCSKDCWGKYVGIRYGLLAHPENRKCGGRNRKWDYAQVYAFRDRTGWGTKRIGRALGIPRSSVKSILQKRVEVSQVSR